MFICRYSGVRFNGSEQWYQINIEHGGREINKFYNMMEMGVIIKSTIRDYSKIANNVITRNSREVRYNWRRMSNK